MWKILLQLEVTDGTQTLEKRLDVKDVRFAKFRANQLKPIFIYDTDEKKSVQKIQHVWHDFKKNKMHSITYEVDVIAYPSRFTRNVDIVCGKGIHYFNTLIAAFYYMKEYLDDISFNDCGEVNSILSFHFHEPEMLLKHFGISDVKLATNFQFMRM